MAGIGDALDLGGAGVGAFGALYSGQATADTLDAQADINQGNAQIALQQGVYDSFRHGLKINAQLGSMRANIGASGVSASSGSALDLIQSSVMNGEMDKQNIMRQAQIKSIGFQNEASLEKWGASNALTASYFNALSFGMKGASSAFGSTSITGAPDVTSGEGEGEEG